MPRRRSRRCRRTSAVPPGGTRFDPVGFGYPGTCRCSRWRSRRVRARSVGCGVRFVPRSCATASTRRTPISPNSSRSELVMNAVLHGRAPVVVRVSVDRDSTVLEVYDADDTLPVFTSRDARVRRRPSWPAGRRQPGVRLRDDPGRRGWQNGLVRDPARRRPTGSPGVTPPKRRADDRLDLTFLDVRPTFRPESGRYVPATGRTRHVGTVDGWR